jgi:hypothetical protein
MKDEKPDVREQIIRSRYNHKEARHERLENGEWVPWPVLRLDERTKKEPWRPGPGRMEER